MIRVSAVPTSAISSHFLFLSALAISVLAWSAAVPRSAVAAIRTELGLGLNGLLGLGDFGEVSAPCLGGDAVLYFVQKDGGIGARAAGGVHLLRGYSVPTGESIFTGTGTQEGIFEAKQSIWWLAIGPAWTGPLWSGRLNVYLMAGRAIAKASSSQAWINTQGTDPGTTHVTIARTGAAWSPKESLLEIGAELFIGGEAAFWDDPPAIEDGAGNHVLQSRSAAITGVVLRLGYHFKNWTGSR